MGRDRGHQHAKVRHLAGAVDGGMAGEDLLDETGARADHADNKDRQFAVATEGPNSLQPGRRIGGDDAVDELGMCRRIEDPAACPLVVQANLLGAATVVKRAGVFPRFVVSPGQGQVKQVKVLFRDAGLLGQLLDVSQLLGSKLIMAAGCQARQAKQRNGIAGLSAEQLLELRDRLVDLPQDLIRVRQVGARHQEVRRGTHGLLEPGRRFLAAIEVPQGRADEVHRLGEVRPQTQCFLKVP